MENISEFLTYFQSKYDEVSEQITFLCDKKTNKEITPELFDISKELLDFIYNQENLLNPSGNIVLSDEFKNFLITCLTQNDSSYTHSPLYFSTEKGKSSFNYTAPEILRQSYLQLITVYIWCKHFTEQGYSGVLPEIIFE